MPPKCAPLAQVRRGAAAAVGYGSGLQWRHPSPSQDTPGVAANDHFAEPVEIYCLKCRAKTASKDIEAITMKNGRAATRSTCVDCGTRKFRIGVLP